MEAIVLLLETIPSRSDSSFPGEGLQAEVIVLLLEMVLVWRQAE